jgi:hypothetical protein
MAHGVLRAIPLIVFFLFSSEGMGAEIKFIPLINLGEEYNNNLFFDDSESDRVHDVTTMISPGVKLLARTERLDSSLLSRAIFLKYRDSDDLDSTDQEHLARIAYRLTERWDVLAEAGFTRDSRPDRDITVTGLVLNAERRDREIYRVRTDYALSEKTTAGIGYALERDTYDSEGTSDSLFQSGQLVFTRKLDSILQKATGRLASAYGHYDFDDVDVDEYSLSVGVDKQLNELFSLSVDVGERYFSSRSKGESEFESAYRYAATALIACTYTGEKGSSLLTLERSASALDQSQGVTSLTSILFSTTRKFTRKLSGTVLMELIVNKTPGETLSVEKVDDQTVYIQPMIVYSFTESLSAEAFGRFVRVIDYENDSTSRQSLYSLHLTWQYPVPR